MPTARDGGRYPDPDRLVSTTAPRLLDGTRIGTPFLPVGTSGWQEYDSGMVTVDAPDATAASPQIVVGGGMEGTAHFDSIRVTEYGAGWSSSENIFAVVPGNRYRIRGYMRGDEVTGAAGEEPRIGLRLELYGAQAGAAGDGFLPRDKEYLDHAMSQHLAFGAEHEVPMSVLEFGAVRHAFEMEGKGGDRWVADVLALLREHDLSFGYWEYHDSVMGIYLDLDGAESRPNDALQEVLRRDLHEDGG